MSDLTKTCKVCHQTKSRDEFYKAPTKDGHKPECKRCLLIRHEAGRLRRRAADPDRYAYKKKPTSRLKRRQYRLKLLYGIGVEEYDKLSDHQGGVCALCGQPETKRSTLRDDDGKPVKDAVRYLSVDHCHATGRIRGLLCGRCNSGIGYLKDDPKLLENAYKYLTNTPLLYRIEWADTTIPQSYSKTENNV